MSDIPGEIVTIYMPLLDEGTDVIRPMQAKIVGPRDYLVLPTPDYDPEDEHWEFLPGSVVECEVNYDEDTGDDYLVARTLVRAPEEDLLYRWAPLTRLVELRGDPTMLGFLEWDEIETIYMPLLGEGKEVLRRTLAKTIGPEQYLVLPVPGYDPKAETWAFPPGSLVQCVVERQPDGKLLTVARTKLQSRG